MTHKFDIRLADWHNPLDQAALKEIRTLVFIQEQQVPPALEWDADDATALHLLALASQQPIACVRLVIRSDLNLPSSTVAKIGRMAVLSDWRKQGVGRALISYAIAYLHQHGVEKITLSAQQHAMGFYQRVGFVVTSTPYQDAGIPHVDMQLINQHR